MSEQPPELRATPWQTVGPFWSIGMDWPGYETVGAAAIPAAQRIEIAGQLLDGDGLPVEDAVLETWQADGDGRHAHPEDRRNLPPRGDFVGFGRCGTAAGGSFALTTLRPGRVPAVDGRLQAPHILVSIFARGILSRLVTRIYFADEASNAEDPVLALVPAERRETLLARPLPDRAGHYRWDIRLQGEGETVFFLV